MHEINSDTSLKVISPIGASDSYMQNNKRGRLTHLPDLTQGGDKKEVAFKVYIKG